MRSRTIEVLVLTRGSILIPYWDMPRKRSTLERISTAQIRQTKARLAGALKSTMRAKKISTKAFARQIGTSPAAVRRILDQNNTSISFATMFRALSAANLSVEVTTKPLTPDEIEVLAQNLVDAPTPAEQDTLEEQLVAGFYGKSIRASR